MERSSSNSVVETRKGYMISQTSEGRKTISLTTAHFLKPSVNSIKGRIFNLPSHRQHLDTKLYNPNVKFIGWPSGKDELWKKWVDKMAPIHSPTCKKAGIFEAIMNSKCEVVKDNELVYKLVEKWCPETSSFIFTWGEVTITLEDLLAFGFSVLGSPVFEPLETELKEIAERLEKARNGLLRSKAQKARLCLWVNEFMNSNSDIEHEAFLVAWLSMYALASSVDSVRRLVIPVAVRLANGIRVALGHSVLPSIYRDLKLLRKRFVKLADSERNQKDCDVSSTLFIKSPFCLVQVWAWERFEELCPQPRVLNNEEPRVARWKRLKQNREKVALVLDLARASFKWRPYIETIENWVSPMVYAGKPIWVRLISGGNLNLMLFAKCLRPSKLIGLECSENYYPHRVAMQFGFDQDLPDFAGPFGETDEIAWRNYNRPIDGAKLYVSSRFSQGHVTVRCRKWWNQSLLRLQDEMKTVEQQLGSTRMALRLEQSAYRLGPSNTVKKLKLQSLETPETSALEVRKGLDVMSVDDDNEEADEVLPIEAVKIRKSSDGTMPEHLMYQPTTTEKCATMQIKRSFEEAFGNAESVSSKIPRASPLSSGCSSKNNDGPLNSELKARFDKIERMFVEIEANVAGIK